MPVHLQILIKKLDTISHEEFHEYWSTSHPKVWLNVAIVKKNITSYFQFHVNNQVMAGLKEHGLPVAEYDGGVNMWAESVEDLMAVFQDEEYNRVVVPDEESFLKRSEAVLLIGHDEDKFVDGKVVEGVNV